MLQAGEENPCASRLKAGRGSTPGLADSAPQPFFRRHYEHRKQLPLQKTAHDSLSYCMRMPFYPWRDNAQVAGARILKRRKFSRLSFFLYNNPCVLHCKISDSPKKGIGLFFFFSKCGVVKICNDFSKFLLILWFHPKCVDFLRMKGKALIFFFLEVNVLRYSDVYLFVSWTFIYVTYSVISQNHCKNSMGLDHPFLESVTDTFMVSGGSSV